MRFLWLVLGSLMACGIAHASGDGHVIDIAKTDIIERLINFVIFVALMWYLLANRLKAILHERTQSIANQLSQTQTKVRQSREKKEKAQERLKEAHEQAKEILITAKKEAQTSVLRIEEKTKEQIDNLLKANKEAMEFQENILRKQLISEVLQEIFASPSFKLDAQDYMKILEKKVV